MTRKLLIVGLGHVGATYARIASENKDMFDSNYKLEIWGYDTNEELIQDITIGEHELSSYIKYAESDPSSIGKQASCILMCVSTEIKNNNRIDAENIVRTLKDLDLSPGVRIIIKSTVPIGFCDEIVRQFPNPIFFCPEFLREGTVAYNDVMKTKRIYLAYDKNKIGHASNIDVVTKYLKVLYPSVTTVAQATFKELEMVKLARNNWYAMRVSFFNELHRLCTLDGIDTDNVIDYMCGDSRIGDFYNTLSFGFGGYCLPKDSRELTEHANEQAAKYSEAIGFPLLNGVQSSNNEHLWFHSKNILKAAKERDYIVFYELGFKESSNNPTSSATSILLNLILLYSNKNIKLIVSDDYKFDIKNERVSIITEEDVVDGDLIVTEWKISYVLSKFKNCEIYHPRMT